MKVYNPECTYLHCFGDSEDTFTKQEIQAGYVTSGRDVIMRQQQVMAVSSGGCTKKRVGGGGPSGTGKIPNSPVFPPPIFHDSRKSSYSSPSKQALTTSSSTRMHPANAFLSSRSSIKESFGTLQTSRTSSSASTVTSSKATRYNSLPYSSTRNYSFQSRGTSCSSLALSPKKPKRSLIASEILSCQQNRLKHTNKH
jgi:hypothetical protein